MFTRALSFLRQTGEELRSKATLPFPKMPSLPLLSPELTLFPRLALSVVVVALICLA